jgi:hypothetical protein
MPLGVLYRDPEDGLRARREELLRIRRLELQKLAGLCRIHRVRLALLIGGITLLILSCVPLGMLEDGCSLANAMIDPVKRAAAIHRPGIVSEMTMGAVLLSWIASRAAIHFVDRWYRRLFHTSSDVARDVARFEELNLAHEVSRRAQAVEVPSGSIAWIAGAFALGILVSSLLLLGAISNSGVLAIEKETRVLYRHLLVPEVGSVMAFLPAGTRVPFEARGFEKSYMWWRVLLDGGRRGFVVSGSGAREIQEGLEEREGAR